MTSLKALPAPLADIDRHIVFIASIRTEHCCAGQSGNESAAGVLFLEPPPFRHITALSRTWLSSRTKPHILVLHRIDPVCHGIEATNFLLPAAPSN